MMMSTILKLIWSEPAMIPDVVWSVLGCMWEDLRAELEVRWAKARIIAQFYFSRFW